MENLYKKMDNWKWYAALPTDMIYNTGIATYIWVLTNRKEEKRKGKIQLVNATD